MVARLRKLKKKSEEMALKVCVIIPTYNEKENIELIINETLKQQRKLPKKTELNLLIVDDNSPDGTSKIVKKMQKEYKNLHLLINDKKNGLGAAYIKGFGHAIEKLNPDLLIEMDADFSHDPKEILVMIDEAKRGNDFIIGSRYIKGGSIPENWGFKRVLLSKGANLYTRAILGLWSIRDCSGGYRAIKTSIIKQIPLTKLPVKGYGFQAAILYASKHKGAKIVEIPINFKDRTNGESKMRLKDIIEWGTSLLRMRINPRWLN